MRLMASLLYKSPVVLVLMASGLIFAVLGVLSYAELVHTKLPPYLHVALAMYLLVFMPLLSLRRVRSNFRANKRIQEQITYDIDGVQMKMTGETFNSEAHWSSIHKIIESKDFFLVYPGKTFANLIPKNNLSESGVSELREILRNVDGAGIRKLF